MARSWLQTQLKSWSFQASINAIAWIALITARIVAYLISHPPFNIWNISYITLTFIPHRLIRTHKWPAPNVSSFIAQLVGASYRYHEITGSNPVEVLNFSGLYILKCINCVNNCQDHRLLDFTSAAQYMKYFIHNFSIHSSRVHLIQPTNDQLPASVAS